MSDWKMNRRPALVLLHMQKGIVGKGDFIPGRNDKASKAIKESGMIERIQELLKAFRDKKLPVVFVSTFPNPLGVVPAYGWLMRNIEDAKIDPDLLHSERTRDGLDIIPEMNRRPDEPILWNWLLGGFSNSGLDLVLKQRDVKTVVLAGFAAHSVVYITGVQACDHWYSVVIPRDASTSGPGPKDRQAYDAVMDVMFSAFSLVTTTNDVIAHL